LGKVKNENLSKKVPKLSRVHVGRALPEVRVEDGRSHSSTLFTRGQVRGIQTQNEERTR
jgi:hypothetical protein